MKRDVWTPRNRCRLDQFKYKKNNDWFTSWGLNAWVKLSSQVIGANVIADFRWRLDRIVTVKIRSEQLNVRKCHT